MVSTTNDIEKRNKFAINLVSYFGNACLTKKQKAAAITNYSTFPKDGSMFIIGDNHLKCFAYKRPPYKIKIS
jgi:hypothetical protein